MVLLLGLLKVNEPEVEDSSADFVFFGPCRFFDSEYSMIATETTRADLCPQQGWFPGLLTSEKPAC